MRCEPSPSEAKRQAAPGGSPPIAVFHACSRSDNGNRQVMSEGARIPRSRRDIADTPRRIRGFLQTNRSPTRIATRREPALAGSHGAASEGQVPPHRREVSAPMPPRRQISNPRGDQCGELLPELSPATPSSRLPRVPWALPATPESRSHLPATRSHGTGPVCRQGSTAKRSLRRRTTPAACDGRRTQRPRMKFPSPEMSAAGPTRDSMRSAGWARRAGARVRVP
jgi:hypothetical protein